MLNSLQMDLLNANLFSSILAKKKFQDFGEHFGRLRIKFTCLTIIGQIYQHFKKEFK